MRFKLIVLLIGMALPLFSYSQNNNNEVKGDGAEYAIDELDQQPEFPNGNEGLVKYLSENIVYPKKALKKSITGRVLVQFIIDKTGKVVDVTVPRSIDKSLDKEAVRVIKAMPNWKPGMKGGQPVKVKYTIPINFKL